jgi:hypothetical protein
MKSIVVALATALLVASPASKAVRAGTVSPPIDVEVAVDTTGSMDVSIQNAKSSAAKLVGRAPRARHERQARDRLLP